MQIILQWRRDGYKICRYKYDWMLVMNKIVASEVIKGYGMSLSCKIGELWGNE